MTAVQKTMLAALYAKLARDVADAVERVFLPHVVTFGDLFHGTQPRTKRRGPRHVTLAKQVLAVVLTGEGYEWSDSAVARLLRCHHATVRHARLRAGDVDMRALVDLVRAQLAQAVAT